MNFEETEDRLGRLRLRRYLWRPDGVPRGGVAMVHGLGDHLRRYEHVARFFVARGFACAGVDFPGHGRSSGQRGHIPSWQLLAELLDENFRRLRDLAPQSRSGPGLFAHSMGAYVALDYLGRKNVRVQFVWLSSPLIQPSHGRPEWLVRMAGPLGRWLPRVPYDTHVRSGDCVVKEDAQRDAERAEDPYLHHRTTLGFGRELVLREGAIREGARLLDADCDLLITHGTEDRVCPYHLSRELFERLPLTHKRFVSLEGERHEPLHGDRQGAVFTAAAEWLDQAVLSR